MATATEPDTWRESDTYDDIVHLYCECDPDTALCGLDISDMREATEANDDMCVVCWDLFDPAPPGCGKCGAEKRT